MTGPDPVAQLGALLEEEAQALRRADFAALVELTEAKTALAAQVGALALRDGADLSELVRKARRNAASLRAAIGGLRAARLRLGELTQAAQGSATYDSQGRKSLHPARPGQADWRA